ncbi:hypothetical protein MRX96_004905 [Rhipicephalus microplus]
MDEKVKPIRVMGVLAPLREGVLVCAFRSTRGPLCVEHPERVRGYTHSLPGSPWTFGQSPFKTCPFRRRRRRRQSITRGQDHLGSCRNLVVLERASLCSLSTYTVDRADVSSFRLPEPHTGYQIPRRLEDRLGEAE